MQTAPPPDNLPVDLADELQPVTEEELGPLSNEGIVNILAFLDCARAIVRDILARGYTVQNGRLVPPSSNTPQPPRQHIHE